MKRILSTLVVTVLFIYGCDVDKKSTDETFEGQIFTYTESNEIIANPERGVQKYSITDDSYYSTVNYSNIDEAELIEWRTGPEKVTVLYRYFLLGDFLESEISQTYLENIMIDFDRIRNTGVKCLVRFSYTNRQSATEPQQPTKELILEHINQLAPVLEENKDVIVAQQAGFIGIWGEWYYTNSDEFGTDGSINETQWANRKDVVDAMLAATPMDIPLQVRYPEAKINMYGETELTDATSYTNTPQARIGFYNDAFLNVWGDMGTYRVSGGDENPVGTEDFKFLQNETQYLPMTGETNGLNPPRTDDENALEEMDLANWSIVNQDYHPEVVNGWIASGYFDEMLKYLGYRFVIKEASFLQNGNLLDVSLQIENKSYARPFRERGAYLIFKHTGTGDEQAFTVPGDIRTWEGEFEIMIPVETSELESGMYEVSLSLPDNLLEDRPEYAVQFANEGIWNSEMGRNILGKVQI